MAEIKLRYNVTSEEVELLVDGEVAFGSGSETFKSWVDAYNNAHPLEPKIVEVPAPVPDKVVEPGNEVKEEPQEVVDTLPDPVVDSTESGESDTGGDKQEVVDSTE